MDNEFQGSMKRLVDSLLYSEGRALYEANVAVLKAKDHPLAEACLPWGGLTVDEQGFWEVRADSLNKELP